MTESTVPCRAVMAATLALAATRSGPVKAKGATPVYQLRIYKIFECNKAAFHARFHDHAARIMRRHGFDIVAMWEARAETGPEFVYLLHWPDEVAMKARWAGFMEDEEWSRIKDETAAQHGQLVGRIDSRVMQLTPYSGGAV
jgi:NIPSNAP